MGDPWTASSLGERIKLRLKRMGLTQQDLVRRTGLNKGTISRIVNDQADPQSSTLQKVARALEMTASELYAVYPEGDGPATLVAEPKERPTRASGILVVGSEARGARVRLFEKVPARRIETARWQALEVVTERLAPLARPGQYVLFSEDEPIDEGDLVFCELRDGRQYVARCRFDNVARTAIALLDPVPPAPEPLVVRRPDLVSFCKIVGVKF